MQFTAFKKVVQQSQDPVEKSNTETQILPIALNQIITNPNNTTGLSMNVDDLVETIKDVGLLSPIVVRKIEDDKYMITSGERRYHAYEKLYHETQDEKYGQIPAIIIEPSNIDLPISERLKEKISISIPNTSARQSMSFYTKLEIFNDFDEVYEQLKANHYDLSNYTNKRDFIAKKTNTSSSEVQRTLLISKNVLPKFQNLFNKNKITQAFVLELATLSTKQQQVLANLNDEEIISMKKEDIFHVLNPVKEQQKHSQEIIQNDDETITKIELNLNEINEISKKIKYINRLNQYEYTQTELKKLNPQLKSIHKSLLKIEQIFTKKK
mgnify:CR=1 FL=1